MRMPRSLREHLQIRSESDDEGAIIPDPEGSHVESTDSADFSSDPDTDTLSSLERIGMGLSGMGGYYDQEFFNPLRSRSRSRRRFGYGDYGDHPEDHVHPMMEDYLKNKRKQMNMDKKVVKRSLNLPTEQPKPGCCQCGGNHTK